jgi:hypothetical protein
MFYGLRNLDKESRRTYVQFVLILPDVRSSLSITSINGRTDRVIGKGC